MTEIECPTCETRFEVTRELGLGDKVECPECGELLRVTSLAPIEVEYWEEETEEEDELNPGEGDLLNIEEDYVKRIGVEDEENETFELPGKSTLIEEIDEEGGVRDEESGESD